MDSDDEALSWDGDIRDPTYVDGASRPAPKAPRERLSSDNAPQEPPDADDDDSPAPIGSALLIAYGALAAVYVLFTIGWIIASVRSSIALPNPFFDVMYRIGQVFACAAPAFWFGIVFLLTKNYSPRRATTARLVALVVGMLLLAPWPFIVGAGS